VQVVFWKCYRTRCRAVTFDDAKEILKTVLLKLGNVTFSELLRSCFKASVLDRNSRFISLQSHYSNQSILRVCHLKISIVTYVSAISLIKKTTVLKTLKKVFFVPFGSANPTLIVTFLNYLQDSSILPLRFTHATA